MNKPCKQYKLGGIECAVWANTSSDGKNYFTFTFQKNYKDKQTGEWKRTSFFQKTDLPVVAMLCGIACCDNTKAVVSQYDGSGYSDGASEEAF